ALVDDYLADLSHANRSPHTRRAYGADLVSFARFYHGPAPEITPEVLHAFFATIAHLAPATRARKEAAIASFLGWAYRHDLIPGNPMGKVERVHLEPPTPRGIPLGQSTRSSPSHPPNAAAIGCSSA